jgi:hypothetical protein
MDTRAHKPSLPSRLFWTAALTAHAFAAAVWWWLMPGGFPIAHPRFWANCVAPAVMLMVVVASVVARARKRPSILASVLIVLPAIWLGLVVGLVLTFPVSGWIPGGAALGVCGVLVIGWVRSYRNATPVRRVIPIAIVAAAASAFLPLTQRAGPPTTRPLGAEVLRGENSARDADNVRSVRLRTDLMVQPVDGLVTVRMDRVSMTVQPLLTFISRSPDGFWSNLSPHKSHWLDPPHELASRWWIKDGVAFNYLDPATGESSLGVTAPDTDALVATIEAVTRVDEPVYTHLNTFAELGIYGHRALALSFSPCPDVRVEVTPSDYPVGRPARCAYLDEHGTFHVVEATSGEKGPFKSLATGKLARGEPLTITLYDAGEPLCRITLDDFAAQASTDRSPTAGWGLPVNAIEFSRYGDATSSPIGISITLAGTSVGRGWDTVGHAAGTYRNRMRVESLGPAATQPATTQAASEAPAR